MFLKKFARPNKKIRFGRMIASVGSSQCVHANHFDCIKACRHNAGQNSLNAFSLFRLQCELSLTLDPFDSSPRLHKRIRTGIYVFQNYSDPR